MARNFGGNKKQVMTGLFQLKVQLVGMHLITKVIDIIFDNKNKSQLWSRKLTQVFEKTNQEPKDEVRKVLLSGAR